MKRSWVVKSRISEKEINLNFLVIKPKNIPDTPIKDKYAGNIGVKSQRNLTPLPIKESRYKGRLLLKFSNENQVEPEAELTTFFSNTPGNIPIKTENKVLMGLN